MRDVRDLLRRQAEWQKGRKALSWPEKVRMAEAIRDSVLALRRTEDRPGPAAGPAGKAETTR